MSVALEVIAVTVEDAVAAELGGADRIELIANPLEGGTTPSAGVIRSVEAAVSIPVYVMIRPRGGGFHYSESELEAMAYDARLARDLGADGIVTGVLTQDRSVDVPALERILAAAGLPATFHRAFDAAADLLAAMECLARVPRVERILTSGGRAGAYEGRRTLRDLAGRGSLEIMAGAGVTLENVAALVQETGVQAVHIGSAARDPQEPAAPVSAERVRRFKEILRALEPRHPALPHKRDQSKTTPR